MCDGSKRYTLDMSKCTARSCPMYDILHGLAGQMRQQAEEMKMLRKERQVVLAAKIGQLHNLEDELDAEENLAAEKPPRSNRFFRRMLWNPSREKRT